MQSHDDSSDTESILTSERGSLTRLDRNDEITTYPEQEFRPTLPRLSLKGPLNRVKEIFGRRGSLNQTDDLDDFISENKPSTAPESSSWLMRSSKRLLTDIWKGQKGKDPVMKGGDSEKSKHLLSSNDTSESTYEGGGSTKGLMDQPRTQKWIVHQGAHNSSQEFQQLTTTQTVDHPISSASTKALIEGSPGEEDTYRMKEDDNLLNTKEKELNDLVVHCDLIVKELTDSSDKLNKRIEVLQHSFEDSTILCESYQDQLKKRAERTLKEINDESLSTNEQQASFDRMNDQLEHGQERLESLSQQLNTWHDHVNGLNQELRILQWKVKRSRLKDMFYMILSGILFFIALLIRMFAKVYTLARGVLISKFPFLLNESDRRRQLQQRLRRMSSSLQPEEWAKRLKLYFEKQEQNNPSRDNDDDDSLKPRVTQPHHLSKRVIR